MLYAIMEQNLFQPTDREIAAARVKTMAILFQESDASSNSLVKEVFESAADLVMEQAGAKILAENQQP